MVWYHATTEEGYQSILKDLEIKPGFDGCVYLCEKPEEAARFVILRTFSTAIVLGIELPDDADIQESFDHSQSFFQCKAYTYESSIHADNIVSVSEYVMKGGESSCQE